jgi:hypothetical protein
LDLCNPSATKLARRAFADDRWTARDIYARLFAIQCRAEKLKS